MPDIEELSAHLRQWREAVSASRGLTADDVDELEDHLVAEYQDLLGRGLSADEAFLIANHRLGSLSEVASEYLTAHPERAWQQMPAPANAAGWHLPVALALGLVAGIIVRLPLSGSDLFEASFFLRGAAPIALGFLAAYLLITASSRTAPGSGSWPGATGSVRWRRSCTRATGTPRPWS